MHTWKSHLRSVLFRLARTHGNNTLGDLERTLCEVFDARQVRFTDGEDQPLDPQMQLRDTLTRSFNVALNVEFHPQPRPHQQRDQHDRPHAGDLHADSPQSRFRPDVTLGPVEQVDWFIREFDQLEQTHDFMWAGYIVKEMLARIGLTPPEAREMLDRLHHDGIVSVEKVDNPRNPEHPASAVALLRDHERVKRVLMSASESSVNQSEAATDADSSSAH